MPNIIVNNPKSFGPKLISTEAQVKLKAKRQAEQYAHSRPLKLANKREMFLNLYLAINITQERMLKKLKLTPDQYTFVIHLLGCHQIQDNKREDAGANYIPGSDDFFEKFKLHDAWKELQRLGIVEVKNYVNRGIFGSGSCRRFRIVPELMEKFKAAGLEKIHTAKKAIDVLVWNYIPRPQKSDHGLLIKYMLPQMLRINLESLTKSIQKEVNAIKHAPIEQQEYLKASVAHSVQKLQQIQVQLVKIPGGPDHIRGYNPTYIQTAKELRSYESLGGFQGLPSRHKNAALQHTGQTMCDFERAHMQIAHVLCINILKIPSPLQQIVNGDYPVIAGLTRPAVKKIASATCNGAKGTNLKANQGQLALVKICSEDLQTKDPSKLQPILNEIEKIFAPVVQAIEQLTKYFKKNGHNHGRATMSHQYQTYEQEAVKAAADQATGGMVANEHDGWVEQEEQGKPNGNTNPLLNISSTTLQGLTFKIKRVHYPC